MKNQITIHGHLGHSPEIKTYTNKEGKEGKLVNFSVAVGRDQGTDTDWFSCTMFGKRAEVIEKFFTKGSEILVTGRMQNDRYEKDGQKRDSWKVIVSDFDFCGKKESGSGTMAAPDNDKFKEAEEDIPF